VFLLNKDTELRLKNEVEILKHINSIPFFFLFYWKYVSHGYLKALTRGAEFREARLNQSKWFTKLSSISN
jgi:hypothetical protein